MRESEGKHEKAQITGSVWQKCSRHNLFEYPFVSGTGVCPYCLHERLSSICPDCAHDLPCPCTPRASVSSVIGSEVLFSAIGSVGRVANLIEFEPAFRRSKSTAFQFLWFSQSKPETGPYLEPGHSRWIWRMFRRNRGETQTIIRKSKSVAVSEVGEMDYSPASRTSKGTGWYFRSPIKVFRQSKMIFQQRSPLYRG